MVLNRDADKTASLFFFGQSTWNKATIIAACFASPKADLSTVHIAATLLTKHFSMRKEAEPGEPEG